MVQLSIEFYGKILSLFYTTVFYFFLFILFYFSLLQAGYRINNGGQSCSQRDNDAINIASTTLHLHIPSYYISYIILPQYDH
jgi:hypothetical protein